MIENLDVIKFTQILIIIIPFTPPHSIFNNWNRFFLFLFPKQINLSMLNERQLKRWCCRWWKHMPLDFSFISSRIRLTHVYIMDFHIYSFRSIWVLADKERSHGSPQEIRSPHQSEVASVHVGLVAERGQMSQMLGEVFQCSTRTKQINIVFWQRPMQIFQCRWRLYVFFWMYLKWGIGSSLMTLFMFRSCSCSSLYDTAS